MEEHVPDPAVRRGTSPDVPHQSTRRTPVRRNRARASTKPWQAAATSTSPPSSSPTSSRRPASRAGSPRGRPPPRGQGSLAQALIDEGLASSAGVARSLAERYHLPFVDILGEQARRTPSSRSRSPCSSARARCRTLSSGVAADRDRRPGEHRGDRRAPARHALRGRARRRSARRHPHRAQPDRTATDALNARARTEVDDRADRGGGGRRPRGRRRHLRRAARPPRQLDRLPGRRGRSQRRPLRAAGGLPPRPVPDRRRAPRDAADPEAARRRRHDAPQGAREARHRRAPQAPGRPHLAQRRRRRTDARHPRRRPCRRSRASRS